METDTSEEKIGQGLVRAGLLHQSQVEEILNRQAEGEDGLFGIMAMEMGYIHESDLLKYLEAHGL